MKRIRLDPFLAKAVRRIRGRNYNTAIKLLELKAPEYRSLFWYHYLLGIACLRAKDFGGALIYFERARKMKPRDPGVLLGMAVLYLRREETDRAVDLYLEVLELDAHNRIAKQALNIIRKYSGTDSFSLWVRPEKLRILFPPLPRLSIRPLQVLIPAGLALSAAFAAAFLLYRLDSLPFLPRPPSRPGFSESVLALRERSEPVQRGGSFRYILDDRQALRSYDNARTLFTAYRDEAAKVELNRILESNASEAVKNKARLLLSYTDPPRFDTLKDKFSYAAVSEDPVLYRDCYVSWKGRAANLDMGEQGTAFDLLVGYETGTVLEGRVRVEFNFAIRVNPEQPLEVLGQVVPQGSTLMLRGAALSAVSE